MDSTPSASKSKSSQKKAAAYYCTCICKFDTFPDLAMHVLFQHKGLKPLVVSESNGFSPVDINSYSSLILENYGARETGFEKVRNKLDEQLGESLKAVLGMSSKPNDNEIFETIADNAALSSRINYDVLTQTVQNILEEKQQFMKLEDMKVYCEERGLTPCFSWAFVFLAKYCVKKDFLQDLAIVLLGMINEIERNKINFLPSPSSTLYEKEFITNVYKALKEEEFKYITPSISENPKLQNLIRNLIHFIGGALAI
jgi:hypothetical protein